MVIASDFAPNVVFLLSITNSEHVFLSNDCDWLLLYCSGVDESRSHETVQNMNVGLEKASGIKCRVFTRH